MKQGSIWMVGLFLAMGLHAACGDDDAPTPDAAPGVDGGGDADAGADAGEPGTATVFAVAGDFSSTGVVSSIALPGLTLMQNVLAGVAGPDPVVRHHEGRLYIVNRAADSNVTIIDTATNTLVDQIATGASSNPQDVAVKGTTLYVPALGSPGVLLLDTSRPDEGVVGMIDLSELDPNDDLPDCNAAHIVGDKLFVTCGVLMDFKPVVPGKVAVIDTTDNTLEDSFDLQNPNPFGFLRPISEPGSASEDLLIATVSFDDLTIGCLERIHTGEARTSCLVPNSALDGFASGYAYADGTLYVTVTSGYDVEGKPRAKLVSVMPPDQTVSDPLTPEEQRPFDVIGCPDGALVLADGMGGLRIYDADVNELTSSLLDIGLPPVAQGMVCF